MILFTKLHGSGNDFILIDEYDGEVVPEAEKSAFAKRFCDRRYGIGADGILFVSRSIFANLRMRIFNSDGSEAEMCGNGLFCVVKYSVGAGHITLGKINIETLAGGMTAEVRKDLGGIWVKVDMPVSEPFLELELAGFKVFTLEVGVPHAVIFVDDLNLPIMDIAPKIRFDPVFPMGTNVDFVLVEEGSLKIRTYERGVEAETLSCGTGTAACAFIANRLGKVGEEVNVQTQGGLLKVYINANVFLEGTAEIVYEGVIR
ncbi:MAG: diaminopimelate epimerase [Methanocellales archaeon]|nr:diaminopimelate epimerase [Methanocellales archaeon]MDD3420938.1 diaminopimelate epimerase [Methanocellales archaeon]MDD4898246.1 diaminopimelate epimerase [Methanocellales archaeon]MDD5447027.1 diaminopimelate epimerase [Methanocellales archaeon]